MSLAAIAAAINAMPGIEPLAPYTPFIGPANFNTTDTRKAKDKHFITRSLQPLQTVVAVQQMLLLRGFTPGDNQVCKFDVYADAVVRLEHHDDKKSFNVFVQLTDEQLADLVDGIAEHKTVPHPSYGKLVVQSINEGRGHTRYTDSYQTVWRKLTTFVRQNKVAKLLK